MSWRALNRHRDETGALDGLALLVDLVLWLVALPRLMKVYYVVCVLLGVVLGVMSHITKVSPIALLLGTFGFVLMLSCTLAPLLPDYDRFKDQGQR